MYIHNTDKNTEWFRLWSLVVEGAYLKGNYAQCYYSHSYKHHGPFLLRSLHFIFNVLHIFFSTVIKNLLTITYY